MIEILYCNEDNIIGRLAESLVIAGLPKQAEKPTTEQLWREIVTLEEGLEKVWNRKDQFYKTEDMVLRCKDMTIPFVKELCDNLDPYIRRGITLGKVKNGTGHDCYLKGVQFNMVINFPLYWLKEYQRYHFSDIISSQSTMHKVTEMDIASYCDEKVDKRIIEIVNGFVDLYNAETNAVKKKQLFEVIVSNLPSGFSMAMGITLNYLQAKSMVLQREHHKLDDWSKDFIPYLKGLPFFNLFVLGGELCQDLN